MALKKFIEQHFQLHTLRIELKSGRVLRYQVDSYRKEELEEWMRNPEDPFAGQESLFLSFFSYFDRIVFVRICEINRIIFCWDHVATVTDPAVYSDPFDIIQKPLDEPDVEADNGTALDHTTNWGELPEWLQGLEEPLGEGDRVKDEPLELDTSNNPDIPNAIVLLAEQSQPYLFYDLDEEVDSVFFTDSCGFNNMSIEGRFLSFADEDGENNYIPVENIICLDVTRRLVFSDVEWEAMERSRRLDENTN